MTVDSEQHAIAKFRYLLNKIVQYENLKEYLKFAITVTLVPDIKNYMKIVVFLIFDVLLIHMYVYKADSVLRFTWLYSNPYLTITYSILHIKEFSQYQHQIANKCTATKIAIVSQTYCVSQLQVHIALYFPHIVHHEKSIVL